MSQSEDDSELRERAQTWLRTTRDEDETTPTNVVQNFVYDLQVHQVELAMQHEQLRRVESELQRTKDRYQALYELAPVAYLTLDAAGLVIELNQRASTLLGLSRAELCGSSFADRIAPAERARFHDQHRRTLELGSPCSYELTLATRPLRRAVRCEAQPDQTANGKRCVLLVLCDITEQRLADKALRAEMTQRARTERILRRERELAEGLLATTPGLLMEVNRQGRILRCNRNFEQITGYRLKEILGADAFALLLSAPAQEALRTRFSEALREASRPFTSSDIVPIRTRSGEERAVAWTSTVMTDEQGQAMGLLLVGLDMTERQRLEAELRQSQKMEAIGLLASGIAHDFNNLLLGQAGLAELATNELLPDNPAHSYLTQIKQTLAMGAGLTRQLLDFARKRPAERVSVDLSRLVERSAALLRCLLRKDIELQFELGEGVWVTGDPGQLEQVLLNLFVNARDALPNGGTLRVITTGGCAYGGPADAPAEHPPAQYAMLTVSDNGVGMDADTQRRVYEPFFTTKKVGAGTGLGLATVYGIVTQSGGHIHLRSAPGQGTTFEICLHKAVPPAPSIKPPLLPAVTPGSGETILLLEDEETVRTLCRQRLQGQGYRVLMAETSAQALQLCRAPVPIALAILDIILPGALGEEVARAMTQLRPEMPILYMSALPPDQLLREGRLHAQAVSLQKPFSEYDLLSKVRELLRHRAPPGPASPAPQVVLVVEDDATNRQVLQEFLELSGYVVRTASGAESALTQLASEPNLDLVLADYGLPGKNGLALVTELLAHRPALRAILITGRTLDDPLLAGATGTARLRLMSKPFDYSALLSTISALLG